MADGTRLLVLLGVGALLMTSGGGDTSARVPPSSVKPGRRVELDAVLASAQADGLCDAGWAAMLRIIARGESNFSSRAEAGIALGSPPFADRNDAPAAALAAGRAFDRNAALFSGSSFPRERYTFGTGGWFAMMPANGLVAFKGTAGILSDPWGVFDPVASVAMALGMARRLQANPAYAARPLFSTIRAGWASLKRMRDVSFIERRMARWSGHAVDAGEPPELLSMMPTPLPSADLWSWVQRTKGVA